MPRLLTLALAGSLVAALAAASPAPTPPPASASGPSAARWPLTLRLGIPASLPGWTAAPSDPLPDDGENEMGRYTEVSRFFQRIESPTSTKQFQIAVHDYGPGRDLAPALKKAVAEASKSGAEARETDVAGLRAFVVTDRSTGKPATLVTVVVSGGRLVLGEGSNVTGDEALRLLRSVDYARIAAAKP